MKKSDAPMPVVQELLPIRTALLDKRAHAGDPESTMREGFRRGLMCPRGAFSFISLDDTLSQRQLACSEAELVCLNGFRTGCGLLDAVDAKTAKFT